MAQRTPETVTVDIALDGSTVKCSPDPVRVLPQDTIEWRGAEPSMTHQIRFLGKSPVGTLPEGFENVVSGKVHKIIGRFKYEVTVRASVGGEEYEFYVDPDVEVVRP